MVKCETDSHLPLRLGAKSERYQRYVTADAAEIDEASLSLVTRRIAFTARSLIPR